MKKYILTISAIFIFALTNAQIKTDLTFSSEKQLGANIYSISKGGFLFGLGGSYGLSTYTGETKRNFQELANVSLGNDGSKWSNAFKANYQYDNFVENRGALKILLGGAFKKTAVYGSLGLGFRSEYWLGKGYDFMPGFTSPEKHFYVYKNISPKVLIGLTASQMINEKVGVNFGYDNIQKYSLGITLKLK